MTNTLNKSRSKDNPIKINGALGCFSLSTFDIFNESQVRKYLKKKITPKLDNKNKRVGDCC